jgi:hypothetical protein
MTAALLPIRGGTGAHPYRDLLRGHRGLWRLAMSSNIFHREGRRLRSPDLERREVLIGSARNLPGPSLIRGWVATGVACATPWRRLNPILHDILESPRIGRSDRSAIIFMSFRLQRKLNASRDVAVDINGVLARDVVEAGNVEFVSASHDFDLRYPSLVGAGPVGMQKDVRALYRHLRCAIECRYSQLTIGRADDLDCQRARAGCMGRRER